MAKIRNNFVTKQVIKALESTPNVAAAADKLKISAPLLRYWITNEGLTYDNSKFLSSLDTIGGVENPAKILIIDIETALIEMLGFSPYNKFVPKDRMIGEMYIICIAAKWLGKDKIFFEADKGIENDKNVLEMAHKLLDEADIIVGHNVGRFDKRKMNARFLKHGMLPPSPYKVVDTLKVVKANFSLEYNSLDYVAKFLNLESKMSNGIGLKLWMDCRAGKASAYKLMKEYNIQDIHVTEAVYKALLPWMSTHPNANIYTGAENSICPKCASPDLKRRNTPYTAVTLTYPLFQCNNCGGFCRGRAAIDIGKAKRKNILINTAG